MEGKALPLHTPPSMDSVSVGSCPSSARPRRVPAPRLTVLCQVSSYEEWGW